MPRLACPNCGRSLYTTTSVVSLSLEERLCANCGALMSDERRERERRIWIRRANVAKEPAPPADDAERRLAERRTWLRRQLAGNTSPANRTTSYGWTG